MTPLLLIPFLAGNVQAVPPGRLDAARAVERARYAFVIGATQSFDASFPPSVFVERVARERAEELVLQQVFGVTLAPAQLAREFDRIERTTRAPEQWEAIKAALGHDRRRIEDAFCRPALIKRLLQARFAFDPRIHGEAHARARRARALMLQGGTPPGAARMVLGRRVTPDEATGDLLRKAKAEAAVPRVLASPDQRATSGPIALHPEAAAALEAQLVRPGDVSNVLSEWDRFTVYRLV
ncbi:MAG: hypothetical protein LUP91_09230, partial [Methylococcaceae bacterium]|nr:hypothetical protein [Methylococcaceae bacterium]